MTCALCRYRKKNEQINNKIVNVDWFCVSDVLVKMVTLLSFGDGYSSGTFTCHVRLKKKKERKKKLILCVSFL